MLATPLSLSHHLLTLTGTDFQLLYPQRLPSTGRLLVVSNHRSFLDAPLLMAALDQSISFACHHYLGQVPILSELVKQLGCVPLGQGRQRHQLFFEQSCQRLQLQVPVGLFPEGSAPMLQWEPPGGLQAFHRGFAHLALQTQLSHLAILPMAILADEIQLMTPVSLPWLQWFDSSEPLFQQPGQHPLVLYRHVRVATGFPIWITPEHRDRYRGRGARAVVQEICEQCHDEIATLLRER